MDFGRIVTMIVNTLLRRAVNAGVNKGISQFSKGKGDGPATAEDKAQAAKGRDMSKRARQAARITRKIGR